jgi:hypothetical protein
MVAASADQVVIAPAGRDALGAAVGTAVQTKKCVLWLNDPKRFLGPGGIDVDAGGPRAGW